ncbi:MAG: large ATP-binding protein [Minisyncoccia bacterium]
MTSGEHIDWLSAIAETAKAEKKDISTVLASHNITPSPVVASPKRLTLKALKFSGQKTGLESPDDFTFEWDNLDQGLWAVATDGNLKGKSSVLNIIQWLLRGRAPEKLQEDVKSWLHDCELQFSLEDEIHLIRINFVDAFAGSLHKVNSNKTETELARFDGVEEFEAVMSEFFMKAFALETVTIWRGNDIEQGGGISVHSWPALSGAMFIGTNYSVLLGDLPPTAGISSALLRMYLGLPWVSTLTAAKSAHKGVTFEQESKERRKKERDKERQARANEIRIQLEEKQHERDVTPSDSEVRVQLASHQKELSLKRLDASNAEARFMREKSALESATTALASDKQDLQAHKDAVAAGAVFRKLDPTCCPRCDTHITYEKKQREQSEHTCSVCGEHTDSDEDMEAKQIEIEKRIESSQSACEKAQSNLQSATDRNTQIETTISSLENNIQKLSGQLASFGMRQQLDLEVAMLEAKLEEASRVPESQNDKSSDEASNNSIDVAQILKATVTVTEKRVKEVQDSVLEAVSEEIVSYAKRFGMTNLQNATLKGNATLSLTKGGKETTYSKLTLGEKLRVKVSAVLAMIKVAEKYGVGRHPGLLMIDSPGAQEVSPHDLNELISGLEEVSSDFKHLQVFIASASSKAVLEHIPNDRVRHAKGNDYLW